MEFVNSCGSKPKVKFFLNFFKISLGENFGTSIIFVELLQAVKSIDKNIPIVIVENSQDQDLKNKLEREHKNVKVIIHPKNIGFSGGLNLGIKESKTNFVFSLITIFLNSFIHDNKSYEPSSLKKVNL